MQRALTFGEEVWRVPPRRAHRLLHHKVNVSCRLDCLKRSPAASGLRDQCIEPPGGKLHCVRACPRSVVLLVPLVAIDSSRGRRLHRPIPPPPGPPFVSVVERIWEFPCGELARGVGPSWLPGSGDGGRMGRGSVQAPREKGALPGETRALDAPDLVWLPLVWNHHLHR